MTPRSWVIRMMAVRQLRLEVAHQIQDLGLNGDIERGRGLVGDEQGGVAGKGHGDHGPLAHAAAQLVRVFVHPALRRGNAHPFEHFQGTVQGVPGRKLLMEPDRFGYLVADGVDRVEGGHRLLENHGDPVAADFAHLIGGKFQQVLPLEQNLAGGYPARRVRDEPHDGKGSDTLAAARLADDTERFSLVHPQVDPVDCRRNAFVGEKMGFQPLDFQQNTAVGSHGRAPCNRLQISSLLGAGCGSLRHPNR